MTFLKNLDNFFELASSKPRCFCDAVSRIETPGDDGRPRRTGGVPTLRTQEGAFGDTGYDAV
jgi:hypothetical protein